MPNQPAGAFWAIVAGLLIIFQTIILFCESYCPSPELTRRCSLSMKSVSEISWPMKFFDRYFPVLGSEFGLGALGIFQCLYVSYPS